MRDLVNPISLKDINALKRKISWGDVPTIYHLVTSSLSDLDGILTHGFDSPYKQILNRNTWNLQALNGYRDSEGTIHVKNKPEIILQHQYNDVGYELLCFPIIKGEKITQPQIHDPSCPFQVWLPESMEKLFRINCFVAFTIFTYQSGDEADLALIKFAHGLVSNLIKILSESFDIIDVEGYNIGEFYQEVMLRNGNILNISFDSN
jgi:hypothetical protein